MNDYRVAAYPSRHGAAVDEVPHGKLHAYLEGAKSTVCGFGLVEMRRSRQLLFSEQPPSARCSMCDRIVRAAAR